MNDVLNELIRFNSRFNSRGFLKELEKENTKTSVLLKEFMHDQDGFNNRSSKSFMMLRRELVLILSRMVPNAHVKKINKSGYYRNYFGAIRDLYASRVLLSIGLYNSGLWLLKRTVKSADNFEIWDVVLSGSTILENYFAIRNDPKSYKYYKDLSDKAMDFIFRLQRLKRIFNKWVIEFVDKRQVKPSTYSQLVEDIKVSEALLKDGDPWNFHHLVFRLKLILYQAKAELEKVLNVCSMAKRKLKENSKMIDFNKYGGYVSTELYCYINLKRYQEAYDCAQELEEYEEEGTLNWFLYMEYYFILLIQTKKYDKAMELVNRVTSSNGFAQVKKNRAQKDIWTLFSAYIEFLLSSGIWLNPNQDLNVNEFKVNKFTNDVADLSKDKTGLLVSILILQVLFLLKLGRFEDIIEKKDALRRYVSRYLNTRENERSRLFLSLLLRMIECEFSYTRTNEKTQRLQARLKDEEVIYKSNLGGNEIVDYEILWDWVLTTLKTKWPKAA